MKQSPGVTGVAAVAAVVLVKDALGEVPIEYRVEPVSADEHVGGGDKSSRSSALGPDRQAQISPGPYS